MKILTESKQIIVKEFKEYKGVISERDNHQKVGNQLIDKESQIVDYPSEEIDKTREEKRWKKGLNYYFLHPGKFDFRLTNI